MTYKDMTFCQLGPHCNHHQKTGCDRVMSEEDAHIVVRDQLLVSYICGIPSCFEAMNNQQSEEESDAVQASVQ